MLYKNCFFFLHLYRDIGMYIIICGHDPSSTRTTSLSPSTHISWIQWWLWNNGVKGVRDGADTLEHITYLKLKRLGEWQEQSWEAFISHLNLGPGIEVIWGGCEGVPTYLQKRRETRFERALFEDDRPSLSLAPSIPPRGRWSY